MEPIHLNRSQIDRLYAFTREHFVEWYDLQSELADHLANAIETEWAQYPQLSFEEVLHKEFKKFGIFGFMTIVEQRQKSLGQRYTKLLWSYYKTFFGLPKILLVAASFFALFFVSEKSGQPEILLFSIFALVTALAIYGLIRQSSAVRKRQKEYGKKWLFEETVNGINILPFVLLPINLINIANSIMHGNSWNEMHSAVASAVIVLFGILLFVQIKVIPVKVAEELHKTYPEYYTRTM